MPNAEEMLKEAIELHYSKRFSEALVVYKSLVRDFPDSEEAQQAIAIIRNLDVKGINAGAILIQSECPRCGAFFYISKDVIGQAGECPKCAQEMVFWGIRY